MSPFSVHIFNNIAPEGLALLENNAAKISTQLEDADAILLRSHVLHQLKLPKYLKAIARAGAGTNNIPIDRMSEFGVVVFNTPGANANAVKELVLSCLIMAARNLFPAIHFTQALGQDNLSSLEEMKKSFKGCELQGKTLGVIGLGAIGSAVANAAILLGMKVKGFDPMLTIERALSLSSEVQAVENLRDCMNDCDFVSLHAPLVKDTNGIINSESLSWLDSHTTLLNFARDELVKADDLKTALLNQQFHSYISDFPNRTLLGTKNCYFLPHLGASTLESEVNCAVQSAKQLCQFMQHGHIQNSVNFPNVELPRKETTFRFIVLNKNIPGALSDIMKNVADDRLNVVNMINQSKNEVAVTLIDTDKPVNPNLIETLNELPSVIRSYVL